MDSTAHGLYGQQWLRSAGYVREHEQGAWLPERAGPAFGYTDGAQLEQALLAQLLATEDRSVLSPALLAEVADWPQRYHFSPRRANLLRPLESLLRGRRVLEIGAGCGAISRYLGEIGCALLALEGSPARARVAAARCAGLDNVTVLAETLQALPVQAQFEVVTLIGVLEYARIFFPALDGQDAVDAMLAAAARFLAPDGVLLVAIENQLGLKYFAGYAEDHLNQPMAGIEDRYRADGVVTFGRSELSARLRGAGLAAQRWLFPLPDYKLPVAVLSEAAVSSRHGVDFAALASAAVASDLQTPAQMNFALEMAWWPVMRNGLGGELANSFLVVAGAASLPAAVDEGEEGGAQAGAVLAWHFAVERAPAYAKRTLFRLRPEGLWVEPEALLAGAAARADTALSMALKAGAFVPGELWQHALLKRLNEAGWQLEQVVSWARRWLQALATLAPQIELGGAGLDTPLPGWMLDAVPRNLVVRGEQAQFIDLEWHWDAGLSLGQLCFRAIVHSLTALASVAPPAEQADLATLALFERCMAALGFGEVHGHISQWHERECAFQLLATGVEVPRTLAALENHRLPARAR